MDISEINLIVESAFGPGAEIFKDVLRIPVSAPQSQVQQAFFVSEAACYNRIFIIYIPPFLNCPTAVQK